MKHEKYYESLIEVATTSYRQLPESSPTQEIDQKVYKPI